MAGYGDDANETDVVYGSPAGNDWQGQPDAQGYGGGENDPSSFQAPQMIGGQPGGMNDGGPQNPNDPGFFNTPNPFFTPPGFLGGRYGQYGTGRSGSPNYYDPRNGGYQNPNAGNPFGGGQGGGGGAPQDGNQFGNLTNPNDWGNGDQGGGGGGPGNPGGFPMGPAGSAINGYGFMGTGGGGSFTGSGTFGGGGGGGAGGGSRAFGGHGSYLNYLQHEADIQEASQNKASGMGQDYISRGMYGTTAPDTALFGVQRGADAAADRLGGNPAMRTQALAGEYNQVYNRIAQDLRQKGITDPNIIHQYALRTISEYHGAVGRVPGGDGGYGGGGMLGAGAPHYRIPSMAYGVMGGGTTDGSQGYYIPDAAWGGA
jgi:hypothetical protein